MNNCLNSFIKKIGSKEIYKTYIAWLVLFCTFGICLAQDNKNFSNNVNLSKYKEILESKDIKSKLDVITQIYNYDDNDGFKIICEHYFRENDFYVKKIIVDSIAYKVDIKECLEVLNDALSNENESIKKAVILSINNENIGKIKNKVYDLIRSEKNTSIKNTAIIKVSLVDSSTETIKIISDEILKGENEEVIKIGFKALSNINTKVAKREIERYSRHKNKKISDEAKKYIKK